MKKIALLGATGSIGQSTIEVVKRHPDKFKIVLASAHSRIEELLDYENQIPIDHFVITGENGITRSENAGNIHHGEDTLLSILEEIDYDIMLNAVVGSAGLKYTVAGLKTGHTIALANKESLVMAGDIITELAKENNCRIIPVDSEHSAIMQCLEGAQDKSHVRRIILTASGGPFSSLKIESIAVNGEDGIEGYDLLEMKDQNPVIKILNLILTEAIQQGASDIHFEPSPISRKTVIRFRLDGVCQEYISVPISMARGLVSRLKIMANLDIAERRLPQDGKIKFHRKGIPPFELRMATLPTAGGFEDVVLRILAKAGAMKLSSMGLSERNYNVLKKIILGSHRPASRCHRSLCRRTHCRLLGTLNPRPS